jgi:glycerophosphoryl diester phosphodiesterase
MATHRLLTRPSPDRPLIIAHRGDSFHAPESTLEAAKRGFESGADAWELDVHLTRDGVPVVIHDESLLRTTNVAERFADDPRRATGFPVSDFTLAELRTLDAGSWFVAPEGGHRSASAFGTLDRLPSDDRGVFTSGTVSIPTLAEALAFTLERDWLVNVELKSVPAANPDLAPTVVGLIRHMNAFAHVLISSFDHRELAAARWLSTELALGVLTTAPLQRPEDYVGPIVGANAYHPTAAVLGAGSDAYRRAPAAQALRVSDIDRLQSAGVAVNVFTVNAHEPGGLSDHLAEIGVTGIFTDDPRGLVSRWAPDRAHRATPINRDA